MVNEESVHDPVQLHEVLRHLAPAGAQRFLDLTVGAGGHARAIAERLSPGGLVVGVDRDREILAIADRRLEGCPHYLLQGDFGELVRLRSQLEQAPEPIVPVFDGILLDLGVSSLQLNRGERGFSFRQDGPLDMRMNPQAGTSAAEWINEVEVEELARAIYEYGEERQSRAVARAIVQARPLRTTGELAAAIYRVLPRSSKSRIDPATRTFQAIRIHVNRELEALDHFLDRFDAWLTSEGRLVVISYHSLEDRRVKQAFRERVREGGYEELSNKAERPLAAEVDRNPRARSARLRAVRKRGA